MSPFRGLFVTMIPNTMLLLLPLLSAISAEQYAEEYTKDDSTFVGGQAPQFRDASEFLPAAQPDPYYVSIKGLPAHQHGFEIVNPAADYRSQTSLTDSQRETIRKQEEFLKTVLEPADSGRSQGIRPSNVHVEQQQNFRASQPHPTPAVQSGLDYTTAPENTFDLSARGGVSHYNGLQATGPLEIEPHKTFHFRASAEQPHDRRIENNFQTTSTIRGQNSDFESFRSANTHQTTKRPSFVFRTANPLPTQQQQQESVFGQSFTSERTPTTASASRDAVFGGNSRVTSFGEDQSQQRFNTNRGSFTYKSTQQDQKRLTLQGIEQTIKKPVLPNQFATTTSANVGFQGQNDDEEVRFISRVNENTAAGATQAQTLRSGNFQAIHPSLIIASEASTAQDIEPNKNRKIVQQRRKPSVINSVQESFGGLSQTSLRLAGDSSETLSSEKEANLEAQKQAENAKYEFSSSVSDSVNDNTQLRQEVRDGLKLTGMYSYSDGYFKRTVFYEADENGYRIVKEENEPIGTGPHFNPNGEIQVNYRHSGSSLNYKIRGDQLKRRKPERRPSDAAADYLDQQQLPVQK